jgi:predicted amidohydrolase
MSARTIRAACVQMRSGEDVQENIRAAVSLIRAAHEKGAQFIATPENTTLMAPDGGSKLEKTFDEGHDPALPVFTDLANDLNVWLLVGSLAIKVSDTKTANRSFLIGPDGRVEARYDKIHLFDVDLPSGEAYRESNTVAPGDEAEAIALPWGRVGMTICYDVRFPQLYRALAKQGADLITVPSAFTVPTGEAHWHVLLRARAIENACFVIAPAQGGLHQNGRKTFGHSLIVGPWGEILAEAGVEPEVILADLDLDEIARVRSRLPSLRHDRPFRSR